MKTDDELIDKIVAFKLLYNRDTSNDYYFIQYITSLLDYIERNAGGFLTELGWSTIEMNIQYILDTFNSKPDSLSQQELTKFCLYMTNCFAACYLFIGMIEIAYEENSEFFEHNKLPSFIIIQLKELQEKCRTLTPQFKLLLDKFTPLLKGEYRSIYNQAKHKGFVKQIFNCERIETGKTYKPTEIINARECK